MITFKKNADFHKKLKKHVKQFQIDLKKDGYDLTVNKLFFDASEDVSDCECGTETYMNLNTGEWETRCKRCPPTRS